jgi:hypothetical protein
MWSSAVTRLSLVAALALSCAAGNKHRPEPMPPRVPDGAGDKRAALRAAAPPELGLEVEHERWNYEAAQEVKDVEQERKAAAANKAAAPAAKSVGVTGQPGAATPPASPTRPGATPQPPPAAAPAPVK